MNPRTKLSTTILIGGDVAVLALVTLSGFATHGELGTAGLRMLTTFVPLAIAWGLVAPWLGVYRETKQDLTNQVWRSALAAFIAAPMAGWLRGLWLDAPVFPIFVLVIAGVLVASMIVWRAIWSLLQTRQVTHG